MRRQAGHLKQKGNAFIVRRIVIGNGTVSRERQMRVRKCYPGQGQTKVVWHLLYSTAGCLHNSSETRFWILELVSIYVEVGEHF